jgi:WD40 repeat protein
VNCLVLLTDNSFASSSQDSKIKIWNTVTGNILQTLNGHSSGVRSLALLSENTLASASDDTTIKIWETVS